MHAYSGSVFVLGAQTVASFITGSPTAGCRADSQAPYCVPQWYASGDVDVMRVPAGATKRYQLALERVAACPIDAPDQYEPLVYQSDLCV